jgi:hypothetical protein
MQTKRFLRGALAAAVLVAACEQGPLPLAEPSGPMGTVTIRVTAAGVPMPAQSLEAAVSPAAARTVVPVSLPFDAYELTFTGERTIVMTVDAADGVTIKLAEGTYTLAVKGKKGGAEIAEGTAAAPIIIIESDTPAEAAVVLSPKAGGADGVFGYDLTLPAVCDAAILTLTDENGATFNDSDGNPVGPVNLLTADAEGTVGNLPPGEYRLALSIVQDIGMVKFANEAVYIYSGLESAFERDFSSVQPIKSIEGVLAYLSSQPPNTAANPYPVDLSGLNLTTDLTLGQLFQTLNQAGRYVALDLSGCTGMTEFDPGTANTGEKFIVSLVLPEEATSVKAGTGENNATFKNFTVLTSVTGNNIITIGDNAFAHCSTLTEASFPLAETINEGAFRATGLETISLPAAITIGRFAFHNCPKLTEASLPKAKTINGGAFNDCKALTEISLPDAETIRGGFENTALTKVDFPKVVTIEGGYTFNNCASLTEVNLPSVKTIDGWYNFMGCTKLATVSLPNVESIYEMTFRSCTSLTTFTLGLKAPTTGNNMLYGISDKTITVNVPNKAEGYDGEWETLFKRGGTNITLIINEAAL